MATLGSAAQRGEAMLVRAARAGTRLQRSANGVRVPDLCCPQKRGVGHLVDVALACGPKPFSRGRSTVQSGATVARSSAPRQCSRSQFNGETTARARAALKAPPRAAQSQDTRRCTCRRWSLGHGKACGWLARTSGALGGYDTARRARALHRARLNAGWSALACNAETQGRFLER